MPAEQASSLEADFTTTRAILIDELGLDEIEFFQASDYAGVIEGIIAGRVDVAQFGGFSYVIATGNGADVSVAGVMTDGPDIEPGYRSYGITQPGSGIESIEDFAGHTICFVDPGSTSGFLFPSEGLLSAGIDPSEMRAGSVLWFHSRTPHRSGPNTTGTARRALFLTYNAAAEGNLRQAYYDDKIAQLRSRSDDERVRVSTIGHFKGRVADSPSAT